MASRKRAGQRAPEHARLPVNRSLTLLGDVRTSPATVQDEAGGPPYTPDIAIWAQADDGMIWGTFIGRPGQRARTLVQALFEPGPPPFGPHTELPGRLVVFDPALAEEVRAALADPRITIDVSEPSAPFEAAFAALFQHLEKQSRPTLDLPDETIAALCAACARLWRAKPWEYAYDDPVIEVAPLSDGASSLYACILGANEEVFGVAFYASLEDYERFAAAGALDVDLFGPSPPPDQPPPVELFTALRQRAILVSFDPKEELHAAYRDQLARNGWSRRFAVVPTFDAMGGTGPFDDLTQEEAQRIALALDALVTFCERHEDEIALESFPVADTVEVKQAGQTVRVALSMPPGEGDLAGPAPPAAVYRFKVSLKSDPNVWRRIEIRSDQTLVDLHRAIRQAFGWDDDHLYAFFLSGRAWDTSTEFLRPGPHVERGERTARVRLDRLNLHSRQRILYIFDFGDEWRHDVRLEKMTLSPDGGSYPRIVEAHGTPPPQYPSWYDDDEADDDEDETP